LGPASIVNVDGFGLAYRRFGRGPNLLLIAGQSQPMSAWPLTWLQALARGHTVTIFDNRGLGLSGDDPSVRLRLTTCAADAAALVKALGIGPVDVLGVSTGGEIALLLAALHPETVSAVVVSGASLGGPETVLGDESVLAALADPHTSIADALSLLFPPGHDEAVRQISADWSEVPQDEVSSEMAARYVEAEDDYLADGRLPALWSTIKVPVLVHNGALDQLIPEVNAWQLGEALPEATVVITPDAGHMAIFQEMETLLPVFEAFFEAARHD
jgi:pimeloyl-ACP methyl ester carboxylesterase